MFIVLEGIDGCGKSTHAKLLTEWLMGQGLSVFLTAEPTGDRIGSLVRQVLSGSFEVSAEALALLFTADRAEHVLQIRRALEDGKVVVCERYFHSTIAYQSAQGVDRKWLIGLNSFAPSPDLVLFLDVDPGSGAKRTSTGEIFEEKEFLMQVRKQYMLFEDLVTVDTAGEKDAVQEEIRCIVGERL